MRAHAVGFDPTLVLACSLAAAFGFPVHEGFQRGFLKIRHVRFVLMHHAQLSARSRALTVCAAVDDIGRAVEYLSLFITG